MEHKFSIMAFRSLREKSFQTDSPIDIVREYIFPYGFKAQVLKT